MNVLGMMCALLLVFSAGCGGRAGPVCVETPTSVEPLPERAVVDAADLLHRRFVLAAVDGEPFPEVPNRPVLEFTEGLGVSGSACNRFRGQGELRDGRLFVKQMAMTRMFCLQPELNQLESALAAMLEAGADVFLDGGRLTLRRDGRELEYESRDWVR